MNRQGSLEWNLETVGKLIIGVAIFVLIVFLIARLINQLFTGASTDIAAEKTVTYLDNRILQASEKNTEQSLIVQLTGNSFITAFDADENSLLLKETDHLPPPHMCAGTIQRPSACDRGKSCICAFRASFEDVQQTAIISCWSLKTKLLTCESYDVTEISGTYEESGPESTGVNYKIVFDNSADAAYPIYTDAFLLVSGMGVRNLHISTTDNRILIDSRESRASASGGGSAGGY